MSQNTRTGGGKSSCVEAKRRALFVEALETRKLLSMGGFDGGFAGAFDGHGGALRPTSIQQPVTMQRPAPVQTFAVQTFAAPTFDTHEMQTAPTFDRPQPTDATRPQIHQAIAFNAGMTEVKSDTGGAACDSDGAADLTQHAQARTRDGDHDLRTQTLDYHPGTTVAPQVTEEVAVMPAGVVAVFSLGNHSVFVAAMPVLIESGAIGMPGGAVGGHGPLPGYFHGGFHGEHGRPNGDGPTGETNNNPSNDSTASNGAPAPSTPAGNVAGTVAGAATGKAASTAAGNTASNVVASTATNAATSSASRLVSYLHGGVKPVFTVATAAEATAEGTTYVAKATSAVGAVAQAIVSGFASRTLPSVPGGDVMESSSFGRVTLGGAVAQAAREMLASAEQSIAGDVAQLAKSLVGGSVMPQRLFHFEHLGDPMVLIADALATFARESATVLSAATSTTPQMRAWAVTGFVAAVDVAAITYWRRSVSKKRRSRYVVHA